MVKIYGLRQNRLQEICGVAFWIVANDLHVLVHDQCDHFQMEGGTPVTPGEG